MTDLVGPRTLPEVRAEYVRCATSNTTLVAAAAAPHPSYYQGKAQGFQTAIQLLDGLPPELCGEHALETLADALNENRRRMLALTRATIQPAERSGRVDALGDALDIAVAAAGRAGETFGADKPSPPHPELAALLPGTDPVSGDDLADWSAYPRLPMDDVVMKELGDLALFLGGDDTSFTGDLLRLIKKADPENLNRIAAGFPRHVRAWVLFNACSPVPARTLVTLLEATAMMDGRRQ